MNSKLREKSSKGKKNNRIPRVSVRRGRGPHKVSDVAGGSSGCRLVVRQGAAGRAPRGGTAVAGGGPRDVHGDGEVRVFHLNRF